MTRVFNDPMSFKDDVLDGFAAAYSRYAERVPGASGFIRRGGPQEGKVSLVVGGGSGHYPSYSGVLGRGFADGCVLGDVFASPSAEQIYRVARAADGGAGIMLAFGNYAGDRLNFAGARDRLVADGVDARTLYVTDDIASATPDEADKRRGIAGTFTVYKIGGAAADHGENLDTVERLMAVADTSTYSFGVAFAGCTLPGRDKPLFTVEPDQMEIGLGIHGEPGVRSVPWMPARELASTLVDAVLAERPVGASGRAAVLLNGLGRTKYEELFVLYGYIARLLSAADVAAVLPEVGEFVTSLDMAGCSLSVTWLDQETEKYWTAPADTPSFRRGSLAASTVISARRVPVIAEMCATTAEASEASALAATVARRAVAAMTDVVLANEEWLGHIDAVAGDGDHGIGMARGLRAARAAADRTDGGVGTVLAAAGAAFGDQAGGTSGILWGIFLSAVGASLGDVEEVTAQRLCLAVRGGAEAIQQAGKAELGDKTMLDAVFPFVTALEYQLDSGVPLGDAWSAAAATAVRAAEDTASLVPKIGRARPLAERSLGTADAGATSMGLILAAVGAVIADCPAMTATQSSTARQPSPAKPSN